MVGFVYEAELDKIMFASNESDNLMVSSSRNCSCMISVQTRSDAIRVLFLWAWLSGDSSSHAVAHAYSIQYTSAARIVLAKANSLIKISVLKTIERSSWRYGQSA